MFDVAPFALSDMVAASAALRRAGTDATSMEEVASEIVRYLSDNLVDKRSGQRVCALVRFYVSQRYEALPLDLQEAARVASDNRRASRGLTCLALLATAGSEPEWNERRLSLNHRPIPLQSAAAIDRLPMVSRLVNQLGIDPRLIAEPDPDLFTTLDQQSYGVMHVAEAPGSPHIPAQDDFVLRYGIASVIGCGGVLPSGELFATMVFTTVPVLRESADQFASLALSMKLAILPFADGRIFSELQPRAQVRAEPGTRRLRSQNAALTQLLEVRERSVQDQAVRLEATLEAVQARADELALSRAALLVSEARNQAIVDTALDAIVTMDHTGAITDFNPAAEAIFGRQRADVIRRPMAELLIPESLRNRHHRGVAEYLRSGRGPILGRRVELAAQRPDGEEFPVELTVTAVELDGMPPMFTAYVRDITARREAERARQEALRHTAHIARTLQDSLLPPLLPQVPGAEVAARYLPAGGGHEIGGDFYDVFETARNDWAIVLGDVCGKGAEAATVTALARYTTRAAAMHVRKPSTVLSMLNDAVLSQHPERFLTAVYLRIRQGPGGLRATVSLGGHPAPLLVTPEGDVRPVGREGLIVGAFPHVDFTDVAFMLPPGHTLLLYTDGVTEARNDSTFFGEDRLRKLLATHARSSAVGIVGVVAEAVRDFEGGKSSDDVAILAVRALEG